MRPVLFVLLLAGPSLAAAPATAGHCYSPHPLACVTHDPWGGCEAETSSDEGALGLSTYESATEVHAGFLGLRHCHRSPGSSGNQSAFYVGLFDGPRDPYTYLAWTRSSDGSCSFDVWIAGYRHPSACPAGLSPPADLWGLP